jgi:hypothetical protein
MDNSACQNRQKITVQLAAVKILRAAHPLYPPDLSSGDFWLFGFLKEFMKYMEFSSEDHIRDAITTIWRDITFDTLQSVFERLMRRIILVI